MAVSTNETPNQALTPIVHVITAALKSIKTFSSTSPPPQTSLNLQSSVLLPLFSPGASATAPMSFITILTHRKEFSQDIKTKIYISYGSNYKVKLAALGRCHRGACFSLNRSLDDDGCKPIKYLNWTF